MEKHRYTRAELETINVHNLRKLLKNEFLGVPGSKSKSVMIDEILDIQGAAVTPSRTGTNSRPTSDFMQVPKQTAQALDTLFAEMQKRLESANDFSRARLREVTEKTNSVEVVGIIDIVQDNYGKFITHKVSGGKKLGDIYIPKQFVRYYGLRSGDEIKAIVVPLASQGTYGLTSVSLINGKSYKLNDENVNFPSLEKYYPAEKLRLSSSGRLQPFYRMADLFCLMGKGQRAIVQLPENANVIAFSNDLICAMNEAEMYTVSLLLDCRPEDVTYLRQSSSQVYYTDFEDDVLKCRERVRQAFDRAYRLAESGKDVGILLNSLDFLQASLPQDTADGEIKKLLKSVGSTKEHGSLTLIALTVGESGRAVFDKYSGMCNLRAVARTGAYGELALSVGESFASTARAVFGVRPFEDKARFALATKAVTEESFYALPFDTSDKSLAKAVDEIVGK